MTGWHLLYYFITVHCVLSFCCGIDSVLVSRYLGQVSHQSHYCGIMTTLTSITLHHCFAWRILQPRCCDLYQHAVSKKLFACRRAQRSKYVECYYGVTTAVLKNSRDDDKEQKQTSWQPERRSNCEPGAGCMLAGMKSIWNYLRAVCVTFTCKCQKLDEDRQGKGPAGD